MTKKRILFVCLGNICRSPSAEGVFRAIVEREGLENEIEIDSAGLLDYHKGNLADPRMRKHALARGYDLTHRSRPVILEDFDNFDYIVAMDHENVKGLLALAPEKKAKISLLARYCCKHKTDIVPDPYYGGADGFEYVLDLLEDACENLLKTIHSS